MPPETFDVADVRRRGRLVDQLEPFTWSADLEAVEPPRRRRACSKSARMMTSRLRHGHVTGDANHTSTAKRVTLPRPEMWPARCFTAAVAEGSGLALDRNGNQGVVGLLKPRFQKTDNNQRDDAGAELRAGRSQRIRGLQHVAALHAPPTL